MNLKHRIKQLETKAAQADESCEVVVRVLEPGQKSEDLLQPGEVVVRVLGPGLSMSDL